MKKIFLSVALFTMLGVIAVSCQKETVMEQGSTLSEPQATYKVSFSVDSKSQMVVLHDQNEVKSLLHYLTSLTREGHHVSIGQCDATERQCLTKETVVFTTGSQTEAEGWALKMVLDGYNVDISFDENNKVYVCTAVK